jgi:hypothetical protein
MTMLKTQGRPELEGWLPAYLRDHLAGSVAAVDIARRRRDAEPDEPSRTAIARLIEDIEEDRARLRGLMSELGIVPSVWKQTVAAGFSWLGAGRSVVGSAELNRLREFEVLLMGVRGKELLWHTLGRLGLLAPASQRLLLRRVASQRATLEMLHGRSATDGVPTEPEG